MAQNNNNTVIFGCGNSLMGDDGFGPAVVEELLVRYSLPDTVRLIDAGTGIREYLLDYLLLGESGPAKIIILDAVDFAGRQPGEVFFIQTSSIPVQKVHDFSLHQFPTVNLLQEIEEHTAIGVEILAAQVERVPEEIEPGLSPSMKKAVPAACEKILQILSV